MNNRSKDDSVKVTEALRQECKNLTSNQLAAALWASLYKKETNK